MRVIGYIYHKKKVYQFDLNGSFIKLWDSCKDASIGLGINESNINACARGNRKRAKMYIFSYNIKNGQPLQPPIKP